jgi:hypothetical protein
MPAAARINKRMMTKSSIVPFQVIGVAIPYGIS